MACCGRLCSHVYLQILAFAFSASGEFTEAVKHSCCSIVLEKTVFFVVVVVSRISFTPT